MKITIEQLIKYGACQPGIDAFRDVFGETADVEWTCEKQIELLVKTKLKKYLNWAFRKKIVPLFSMCGADLCGADLRYADLRDADLRGALFCDEKGNVYRA